MRAAFLPGDSTVQLAEVPRPIPGPGQALVEMRASTICGSDLRAIYHEHRGEGPEGYQGVVAGHEPAGRVVEVGPGVERIAVDDRVVVYHISGCGQCDECRAGYQISCGSPRRAAYGWQRDGGHADVLLAEERDLLQLPDTLSFLDGACVACGFGTAYEALCRAELSGRDRLLVCGLGPVGLAVGLIGRALGAATVVGVEPSPARRDFALRIGAVTAAVEDGDALRRALPDGTEVAVDCSGAGPAQALAIASTRRWGRVVLVGEGGRLDLDVSGQLIHRQLTVHGSWVTSTGRMSELLELLARWDLHPADVVTDTFAIEDAGEAYRRASDGAVGKVGIVWDD